MPLPEGILNAHINREDDYGFFEGFVGFFEGKEKILVVADHSDPFVVRDVDRIDQRDGHRSFCLYFVLV